MSASSPLKYVMLILSGASDAPLAELDGLTPLQAAEMPNLSMLTKRGRMGTVRTIPEGFAASTDIALLTILGYDVIETHRGRAGFAAIPLNVELHDHDWAFSVNFITVDPESNQLLHPTAGYIEPTEAKLLLESLSEAMGDQLMEDALDLEFFPGHSEEHILVDRSSRRHYDDLDTTPPIDLVGRPIDKHAPRAAAATRSASKEAARFLNEIMEISADVFARHEVNKTRRELGEPEASQIWIWGEGRKPRLPPFRSRFPGIRSCIVTTDDLASGIAQCAGWKRLDTYDEDELLPGIARGTDIFAITEVGDVAQRAVRAIAEHSNDLICLYIESPDEASYEGDFAGKIAALEAIDRDVIKPVYDALVEHAGGDEGSWRIIVLPDVCTLTAKQKRDPRPVPFLLSGAHVQSIMHFDAFAEAHAEEADLHIESGIDFLEYALYSGTLKRK